MSVSEAMVVFVAWMGIWSWQGPGVSVAGAGPVITECPAESWASSRQVVT